MNKESVKKYIKECHLECEHNFMVARWKKNDASESASELLCSKCLVLINFQDIAESCGEIKAEACAKPVSKEPPTMDLF